MMTVMTKEYVRTRLGPFFLGRLFLLDRKFLARV
jgi:hypothetical protein